MRAIIPIAMLALYALASVVYVAHLVWHDDRVRRAGRLLLVLAILAHVGTTGTRCLAGNHPLLDTSGMLSLTGLLFAVAFAICSYRFRVGVLGAVISPLVLMLVIGSAMTLQPQLAGGSVVAGAAGPTVSAAVSAAPRLLRDLHLVLVALGVAAFGLAAAVSLLYLYQEGALKAGRLGPVSRRAPPINTLDNLGRRLVLVGFPIFTLAMITGVVWAARLPTINLRPDYIISAIIWLIFASLIVARMTIGLRGRRAAQLTLVGVAAIFVVIAFYVGRRMLS